MFIAHGEKLRKHARWIMAGVLLLLIPSFVALFTSTGSAGKRAAADLPSIGGKPVDVAEYQHALSTATALYMINVGREARRTPEVQDRLAQEAIVRILMLRKAKELGIRVVDSELVQTLRNQPFMLSENGQFDPERYQRFLIYLNNIGISEARYEEILREELTRAKLEQMVTAAAIATPQEVELVYMPYHERATIELALFDVNDYHEPVTVSNEEAQAFYEKNQESFRTPAEVKVRYVEFSIADAEKTIHLTDEEFTEFYNRNKIKYAGTNTIAPPLEAVKAEVQADLLTSRADRAAADRATEFSVRLVPKQGAARPDFATVCAEFGLKSQETDYFSLLDKPVGATASVVFVQQAFALTPDAPTSDPVPAPDGYFVLDYVDSKPSVIPPFDEVKDKVVDEIKRLRIYDATVKRGETIAAELKKLVAAGKTFDAACAELKLKTETPPPFTLADQTAKLPSAQRIKSEVLGMPVGTVSGFVPTISGGLVFYLKDRQPPDPATADQDRSKMAQQILQQHQQALFQAWVNTYAREQGVTFAPRRSQPAPTEEPEAETNSVPAKS
jgi:peptidyl-prolyl cis-trans isomerase D